MSNVRWAENPIPINDVDAAERVSSPSCVTRLGESRWALLVPPVLLGTLVMMMDQAPMHRWAVHLIALVLAISLHFLLVRLPPRLNSFGLILPSVCLFLMAMTLTAQGLEGVRRWVSVGPLLVHLSSLLSPLLLVACAMVARSYPTYSVLLLLSAQAVHMLQPDAGQATAFGIAALFAPLSARPTISASVKLVLLVSVCGAWFLPDPLGPMPFVEDILHRAFSIGILAGSSAILGLLLYAVSPLCASTSEARGGRLRQMLASYFALTAVVTTLGEFPVPLIGYGPSPLIGAFLGIAMLLRAERVLIAEASTLNSGPRDLSNDITSPCSEVLPNKKLLLAATAKSSL